MVRLTLIAAAVIATLSGPLQAQQIGAGTTAGYMSAAAQPLDFQAALRPLPGGVADTFGFQPDPSLRNALTRQILSGVETKDPALAGALGKQPFTTFGPALAAHDISDARLDDALSFMLLALWDAANASSAETTPGQTDSVKRQARRMLVAAFPEGRPTAGVQEASDSIFLNALIVSILSAKVLEERNPSAVAQLQDMASRESLASFGVDFRGLALTEAGLVPR